MNLYIYISPAKSIPVHRNLMYSTEGTIRYCELYQYSTITRRAVSDTPPNRRYMIQLKKKL